MTTAPSCCCLPGRLPAHPPAWLPAIRDKEHSTIIFEGPSDTPLLRLGWNKQDPRFIATLLADSPKVRVRTHMAWAQVWDPRALEGTACTWAAFGVAAL